MNNSYTAPEAILVELRSIDLLCGSFTGDIETFSEEESYIVF